LNFLKYDAVRTNVSLKNNLAEVRCKVCMIGIDAYN